MLNLVIKVMMGVGGGGGIDGGGGDGSIVGSGGGVREWGVGC